MSIDNGGPAYPVLMQLNANGQVCESGSNGMTKREVFAGMAMQGLCANKPDAHIAVISICGFAVRYADELIKQLKETECK